MQSYQIAGRAVVKIPIKELMQIRALAKANIWKAANPGSVSEPIYVDFLDESNDANYPPTWVDVTGLPGAANDIRSEPTKRRSVADALRCPHCWCYAYDEHGNCLCCGRPRFRTVATDSARRSA